MKDIYARLLRIENQLKLKKLTPRQIDKLVKDGNKLG